jgi:hypothetical protein
MDISLNYLYESMNQYHQNVHEYNENMRRYLHLLQDMVNMNNIHNMENDIHITGRNTTYNTTNSNISAAPVINTLIRNFLRNREEGNVFRQTYEDVIVRPSAAQIERATEMIIFDEANDNHNTSCPITLEPFRTGDQVCCIRHCSHMFKRVALMDWFRRNVRCPICRYDIRDYVEPTNEEEQEDTTEFDDLVQELVDESRPRRIIPTSSLSSTLTTAIRSFVNHELQNLPDHLNSAAQLLYTFDIPISLDVSGNYRV